MYHIMQEDVIERRALEASFGIQSISHWANCMCILFKSVYSESCSEK